jgi:RNA polymerase sigma factor (sigma-70 family)
VDGDESSLRADARDRELLQIVRTAGVDAAGLRLRRATLGELLAAHEPLVRAIVRHVLGSRFSDADREDAVQTIYRQLIEHVVAHDETVPFRAVVRRRARWTCLDIVRAREPAAVLLADELAARPSGGSDDDLTLMVIAEFRESLDERDRVLFDRRVVEGVPSKDVALELGMTPGAVDTQRHRLVARLRERLSDG